MRVYHRTFCPRYEPNRHSDKKEGLESPYHVHMWLLIVCYSYASQK